MRSSSIPHPICPYPYTRYPHHVACISHVCWSTTAQILNRCLMNCRSFRNQRTRCALRNHRYRKRLRYRTLSRLISSVKGRSSFWSCFYQDVSCPNILLARCFFLVRLCSLWISFFIGYFNPQLRKCFSSLPRCLLSHHQHQHHRRLRSGSH